MSFVLSETSSANYARSEPRASDQSYYLYNIVRVVVYARGLEVKGWGVTSGDTEVDNYRSTYHSD